MSAVSISDQAKALAMVGRGSVKRDLLLLSLIRQTSLTDGQRRLIEKMWVERNQPTGQTG